jgi:hypothetical protein
MKSPTSPNVKSGSELPLLGSLLIQSRAGDKLYSQ